MTEPRARREPRRSGGVPELAEILTAKELTAVRSLGVHDLGGALRTPPRRHVVPGPLGFIGDMREGEEVSTLATVRRVEDRRMRRRPGSVLLVRISDGTDEMTLTFFLAKPHLVSWHRSRLREGARIHVSGTVGLHEGTKQIVHPTYVPLDSEHTVDIAERPVPVYPLRRGVSQKTMRRAFATALEFAPLLAEVVPADLLRPRGLPTLTEALTAVHAPHTLGEVERGLAYLAFEEAFVLQTIFAQRRAADDLTPAPPLGATGPLQQKLRERLPFTLTAGQEEIAAELTARISRDQPTSVLLQGDVGSGKTVLALLAMLRAVDSGHQAALLAPTEVLAEQHYRTIIGLLGGLASAGRLDAEQDATTVRLLRGSQRTQERRETLLGVTSGDAGIVVGTHALLTESVEFASLGLVVIDEQHRFGVDHRRALRSRGAGGRSPHVAVMTATPIPRSAALAVAGDLDVLTLREQPAARAGTTSFVVPELQPAWKNRMWARVREEIAAGRQVFVVCSRITDAEESDEVEQQRDPRHGSLPRGVEETYQRLRADPDFAHVRTALLHSRLPAEDKQETMEAMARGDLDLLVSTTVIEVGVDVPNASTMVILDAERFGVSQLHQLRGRVGRGEHPGIAFFATGAAPGTDPIAHLEQVAATQDGFELARLDLERRGVGDLVGTQQSGLHRTLRHLDVLGSPEVIEAARSDAARLVASDPDLDLHRGLAEAVDDRLRDADPDVERS
ncbi:MAG: ATP-dependent DNA helicase RecG [Brachybacterium sp.]|nr:ATP-dependent DNA helicase RecG [Brachybacterium sp.]